MSASKPKLLAALLVLAAACEGVTPPRLDQIGDPCRDFGQVCVDDNVVLRCEAGVRVASDCDVVCAERGPAYVADGCELRCVCVLADGQGCTPEETACVADDTVSVCSATQSWEEVSCDELCDAAQLESLGCLDQSDDWDPDWYQGHPAGCWCTTQGTACEAGAEPSCADASTLAACVEGLWVFEDCAASCVDTGQCDPWLSPAACACS